MKLYQINKMLNSLTTQPQQQELELRIASSLLFTRADGTQEFVHDNLRDFMLAFYYHASGRDPLVDDCSLPVLAFYSGLLRNADDFIYHFLEYHEHSNLSYENYHVNLATIMLNSDNVSDDVIKQIKRIFYKYRIPRPSPFALTDGTLVLDLLSQLKWDAVYDYVKNKSSVRNYDPADEIDMQRDMQMFYDIEDSLREKHRKEWEEYGV